MTDSMPTAAELLGSRRRVLVTGGAGFIGGAVVRRLLKESEAIVFNLDKMGYASDLTSIEAVLSELGEQSSAINCNGWTSRMQRLFVRR